MSRKVELGRCDICGRAVVKPGAVAKQHGWKSGHFYFYGEITNVRCAAHGGQGFEPVSPADTTVHEEFWSDSDVTRKVWKQ